MRSSISALGTGVFLACSAALGCGGDVQTTDPTSGGVGGAGGAGSTTATGTATGTSSGTTGTGTTSGTTTGTTSGTTTGTGGGTCATDADCVSGQAWCVAGACVPCDNGGLVCDIACMNGWATYERNGCFPCACAPINECVTDGNCPGPIEGVPVRCYPGNFCWDWCPPGDPSCCFGNQCSTVGCSLPNPTGCFTTGCPEGQECQMVGCASSGCDCDGQSWACDADCGGGTCVVP